MNKLFKKILMLATVMVVSLTAGIFASCSYGPDQEQKKKEEAEKKKAELAAVKERRYAEIEEARKVYHKLVNDYVKDYGEYSIHNTKDDDDDLIPFLFGGKPWRLWL